MHNTVDSLEAGMRADPEPSQSAPAFFWGVATAGRQVEGGLTADDWEIFTTDTRILERLAAFKKKYSLEINPQPAGVALGHWSLTEFIRSVERAEALGLNAYRFSIEWSRVEPTAGNFDNAALANYQAMVDAVRSRGMEPFVVLNHLSLPAWVSTPPRLSTATPFVGPGASAGDPDYQASLRGWEAGETVDAYLRFVEHVVSRLGEVTYWITFNEPLATIILTGYIASVFPPGFLANGRKARSAIHNLIAAHARAYEAIHAIDRDAQVGITDQWLHCRPIPGQNAFDRKAHDQFAYYHQDYLINALVHGVEDVHISATSPRYERLLGIPESDWRPHLDFFGLQYYKSVYPYYFIPVAVRAPFLGGGIDLDLGAARHPHGLLNDMGWEVYPEGMFESLMKLKRIARFDGRDLPILIAENGTAEVVDHNRSAYITAHLQQMERARRKGANVFGYLHWSICDNWEWIDGYRPEARLGLFSVAGLDGVSTSLRHSITDGALALSHAIRDYPSSLTDAISRYGRYRPDGAAIEHPSASPPATFHGTLDGVAFTLLLGALRTIPKGAPARDLEMFGLLFYDDTRRWVGLKNLLWEPETRTLRFSHRAFTKAPATPERRFTGTLDPDGARLTGSLSERSGGSDSVRSWELSRAPLAGMWQGREPDGGPMTLSLSCPEGIWQARVLRSGNWSPLASVEVDATGFRAMEGGIAVYGVIGADAALVVSPWDLRLDRLPDGLPFQALSAQRLF